MTIALITHTIASGAAPITTGGINSTGSTLIAVACAAPPNTQPTVTDSNGNSWTLAASRATASGDIYIFYSNPALTGSGHTFTSDQTGAIAVQCYSGTATSGSLDKTNSAQGDAVVVKNTGAVTPSVNGEVIVAACMLSVATATSGPSVDSPYTLTDSVNSDGVSQEGLLMAENVLVVAGATNPTFRWTGSVDARAAVATFRPLAIRRQLLSIMGVGGSVAVCCWLGSFITPSL